MTVYLIQSPEDWQKALQIRKQVFVVEQKVDEKEEFDEFEEISRHFIAKISDQAVGTARWRYTEKGIKLERFAVSADARGKGVGQELVKTILQDVDNQAESKGKLCYLHGQITAVYLYEKFGFQKVGDIFDECGILHYKMIRK